MKIAIIGYGKMGKEVERAAKSRGIAVCATIDVTTKEAAHSEINESSLEGADVVIDFTHPDTAVDNIKKVASLKRNMLVGTTGWYDKLDEVKKVVEKSGIGFIYSSNFSVGVNVFFKIIEEAAKLIDRVPEYDAFGYELHHNQKADSPSGTAKTIAECLTANIRRKTNINYDKINRKIKPEELHFASVRAGTIPGTHVVGFDSEADTIELKHTARSRAGFALGAVLAAEWLNGKKGFFEMKDFVREFFG
jgi:4-hydroxy-tetrahydrodipicolinate reductase